MTQVKDGLTDIDGQARVEGRGMGEVGRRKRFTAEVDVDVIKGMISI